MTQSPTNLYIGIDPGWSSCGFHVRTDSQVFASGVYVPKELGSFYSAKQYLINLVTNPSKEHNGIRTALKGHYVQASVERFVAYKGVVSEASEDILMFIGAVTSSLQELGYEVGLVRAIDWKPKLAKWLVRNKNFDNPSTSFDKKFSLAAAEALTGKKPKTDHEADAICLSYRNLYDPR